LDRVYAGLIRVVEIPEIDDSMHSLAGRAHARPASPAARRIRRDRAVSGADDLLAGVAWSCGASAPGTLAGPAELDGASLEWIDAQVPGTAAGALRAAGRWSWGTDDEDLLDGRDWWFRCRFDGPAVPGPFQLELDGLATLADVWLNGTLLLQSETMFLAHRVAVERLEPTNELVIRCAALAVALARRHKRPRWKSRLVRSQSLRWYRTTLLGRMPGWSRWAAPVGPWKPVRLRPCGERPVLVERTLRTSCDGGPRGGTLAALIELRGPLAGEATLSTGAHRVACTTAARDDGTVLVEGVVAVPDAERWWPHTHGAQPLYPVALEIGGERIELGRVGFRTIEVDRGGDGFGLSLNGLPVFCRGACWGRPDAVSFNPPPGSVRDSLSRAREVGMNMMRIGGYTCYEGDEFWDACDELGILVWQDCMIASVDPPEDPEFAEGFERELRQVFGALAGRPSLAVACGSSETHQQASMYGLPAGSWDSDLLDRLTPEVLAEVVPGIPYVPSSPTGGGRPFSTDAGVTHYVGVGAYMHEPGDARLAGVRFAAECLSFGTPPEPETVARVFGSAALAGHDPRWKLTVARDAGTSWDFEDIRDHYVRKLFGVDPMVVRYSDPERALDLGRAAICELMGMVLSDWRRDASPCQGAIVLTLQDLWPGAGWGLVDALGRPKAPFWALRRVFAPTALLITDEGLGGLALHVCHDGPEPLAGTLSLSVLTDAGAIADSGEREIALEGHGALSLPADELLGGFRDLNHAYRFAPLAHDVVAASLRDAHGTLLAQACYLPAGPARPRLADLGLRATAAPGKGGDWALTVSAERFAQYVAIEASGFEPADSWFHLLPGEAVTVALRALGEGGRPAGSVRALNGRSVRTEVADGA
jgi:beta-mannosidase